MIHASSASARLHQEKRVAVRPAPAQIGTPGRPLLLLFWLSAAALTLGCGSSDPSEDEGEGGCDPYACDCREGTFKSGSAGEPARCVGTPLCNEDSECPAARSGTSEPTCRSMGDVVQNGYSGDCRLPCDQDEDCPDGAFCDGNCWFEADE